MNNFFQITSRNNKNHDSPFDHFKMKEKKLYSHSAERYMDSHLSTNHPMYNEAGEILERRVENENLNIPGGFDKKSHQKSLTWGTPLVISSNTKFSPQNYRVKVNAGQLHNERSDDLPSNSNNQELTLQFQQTSPKKMGFYQNPLNNKNQASQFSLSDKSIHSSQDKTKIYEHKLPKTLEYYSQLSLPSAESRKSVIGKASFGGGNKDGFIYQEPKIHTQGNMNTQQYSQNIYDKPYVSNMDQTTSSIYPTSGYGYYMDECSNGYIQADDRRSLNTSLSSIVPIRRSCYNDFCHHPSEILPNKPQYDYCMRKQQSYAPMPNVNMNHAQHLRVDRQAHFHPRTDNYHYQNANQIMDMPKCINRGQNSIEPSHNRNISHLYPLPPLLGNNTSFYQRLDYTSPQRYDFNQTVAKNCTCQKCVNPQMTLCNMVPYFPSSNTFIKSPYFKDHQPPHNFELPRHPWMNLQEENFNTDMSMPMEYSNRMTYRAANDKQYVMEKFLGSLDKHN